MTFISFKDEPSADIPSDDDEGETLGADVTPVGRYSTERYKVDKILGKRRANGEMNLKKLKAVHRKIIAMHVSGLSSRDIAYVLNMDEISIGRILRDPLSQIYIDQIVHKNVDLELAALGPMAVSAVRGGLESGDDRVALLAADRFFKATGRYGREPAGAESAEDVIQRALSLAEGSQALAREAIATKSDGAKVIEMSVTKLPED